MGKENSRGIVSLSGLILSREAFNQTLERKKKGRRVLTKCPDLNKLCCCAARNATQRMQGMSLRGQSLHTRFEVDFVREI